MPARHIARLTLCLLPILASLAFSQDPPDTIRSRRVIYKTIGDVQLGLHIFEPTAPAPRPRPAIVFFFGGGWTGGTPSQFFPHCEHLARKGMVAISAEYRVRSRHQTTPFECVKDGKSAIRWVRAHADQLGVDPRRIAAAGGSAGGHVAACTATIPGLEEDSQDLLVSSRPNLMILFNPVLDTSKQGFGNSRLGDRWKDLSPVDHVTPGICPTLIFHGTADTTVPIENPRRFDRLMRRQGNHCQLIEFPGQQHGFFNHNRGDGRAYRQTIAEMDAFLAGRCWLEFENPLDPESIRLRIERYRTAHVTLTLNDPQGRPRPNTPVTIEMTAHRFLFGCNLFALNLQQEDAYNRQFADLFNFATLPFYWARYEPAPGRTDIERVMAMARWCQQHNITPKGHPLCWHQTLPRWTTSLTAEQFHTRQMARIEREITSFSGRIPYWDVINEVAATPNYHKDSNPLAQLCGRIGTDSLVQQVFDIAHRADPNATLIINDFNTGERAAEIVDRALARGVPIDCIGIQSHMHNGYWPPQKTWEVCRRFARFDIPLHFTEVTILSGPTRQPNWNQRHDDWHSTEQGLQRQARQVEEFYRLLYSHPAVQAITWWDFGDAAAWMRAPAGLIDKDLKPKPAYQVLHRLIRREWWTPRQTLTTSAQGQLRFKGAPGHYRLSAAGQQLDFTIDQAGPVALTLSLTR